jgi:hypothetical protein
MDAPAVGEGERGVTLQRTAAVFARPHTGVVQLRHQAALRAHAPAATRGLATRPYAEKQPLEGSTHKQTLQQDNKKVADCAHRTES